eukprot:Opistho-1_new@30792
MGNVLAAHAETQGVGRLRVAGQAREAVGEVHHAHVKHDVVVEGEREDGDVHRVDGRRKRLGRGHLDDTAGDRVSAAGDLRKAAAWDVVDRVLAHVEDRLGARDLRSDDMAVDEARRRGGRARDEARTKRNDLLLVQRDRHERATERAEGLEESRELGALGVVEATNVERREGVRVDRNAGARVVRRLRLEDGRLGTVHVDDDRRQRSLERDVDLVHNAVVHDGASDRRDRALASEFVADVRARAQIDDDTAVNNSHGEEIRAADLVDVEGVEHTAEERVGGLRRAELGSEMEVVQHERRCRRDKLAVVEQRGKRARARGVAVLAAARARKDAARVGDVHVLAVGSVDTRRARARVSVNLVRALTAVEAGVRGTLVEGLLASLSLGGARASADGRAVDDVADALVLARVGLAQHALGARGPAPTDTARARKGIEGVGARAAVLARVRGALVNLILAARALVDARADAHNLVVEQSARVAVARVGRARCGELAVDAAEVLGAAAVVAVRKVGAVAAVVARVRSALVDGVLATESLRDALALAHSEARGIDRARAAVEARVGTARTAGLDRVEALRELGERLLQLLREIHEGLVDRAERRHRHVEGGNVALHLGEGALERDDAVEVRATHAVGARLAVVVRRVGLVVLVEALLEDVPAHALAALGTGVTEVLAATADEVAHVALARHHAVVAGDAREVRPVKVDEALR